MIAVPQDNVTQLFIVPVVDYLSSVTSSNATMLTFALALIMNNESHRKIEQMVSVLIPFKFVSNKVILRMK